MPLVNLLLPIHHWDTLIPSFLTPSLSESKLSGWQSTGEVEGRPDLVPDQYIRYCVMGAAGGKSVYPILSAVWDDFDKIFGCLWKYSTQSQKLSFSHCSLCSGGWVMFGWVLLLLTVNLFEPYQLPDFAQWQYFDVWTKNWYFASVSRLSSYHHKSCVHFCLFSLFSF